MDLDLVAGAGGGLPVRPDGPVEVLGLLRLFARTSREVQLTDEGKMLLPYAEALLGRAAAFTTEAARLAVPAEQPIRLAYCPLVGALAARVARRLARQAPGVEVELRPAGWSAATADLAQGVAAAAFMSTPFPPGLATAARIGLAQLTRVLLPQTRPPGSLWFQLAGRLGPAAAGVHADLDDLPAALDLVAAGRGLLVTPRLLVETVRRPDVRFVPLDADHLRLRYALVWSQERATARVMALVQTVQEILRTPARPAVAPGGLSPTSL